MKLHCFLLLLFLPAFAHASDFFAYASRLGPQAFDWLTIADCTPFMNAQLSPANFRAYGSDFLVVQELADASKREIDGARNYAYLYRLAIPLQPGFSQLALGIACNAAARKSHALAARGAGIVLLALDAQSQKLSQLATVDYEGSAGGALKEIDEEKETLAGANGSKNNLASLLVSFKPKNAVDASKALLEDQRIADSSAQLFIRVSRALNDLQNEHDAALLALSEEESLAKNAVARLKELELERIPPGVFASGGSFNSFDAVRLDRSHRDAIIDFERCGTLRKQSVVIEKSASEGWLSRSTQKLRAAREECGKAAQLVADAESESIKLEDDLRTRVNTALASVRGALKKVESSNALEAARIGELLNKEEYWNEPGALGARVAMLAVKEQRLKDLQKQALSAQSSAGAVWNAKKEVDELADLAAKAGKDGINAKTQAQLARDLQGALSTGMDSSAASRLSIEASDARQELLDKSQEKFTTLQEEWSELYDLYAFDPAVREVVDKYAEKFGPGARVENALGSLSDAERELGKALRDHEANSENWLKELLQHSLRASKIVDEGLVGEKVRVTFDIEIEAPVVSEAILGDLVVKLPFEVPYDVETLNASDGLLVSGSEARLVNARAGEKYKWVGVSLEQVARVVSFKSVDDVETNSTLVTLSIDSSENAWARYSVLGASAAVPPAVLSGDALRFELAKGSNSVSYVVLKNASSSFAQPVVDVSLLESRFDSLKRECEGLDVSCASLEWSFRAMQSALSRGDSGAFESLALQVEKELSAQREKSLKESGELSQALEDFQGLREKFDAIEQELGVALETDVEGARLGALTLAKQDAVKAVKWRDKLDRASSGGLNLSVGEFKSAFTAFSSAVSGLEDDLLQARASAASEVSAAEQRGAQFPDASSKDLLEKSRSALGDGHLLTAFAIANGLNRDFRLAEGGASVGVAGGLPFWLWGAAGVGVLIVLFVVVRAQSQTRGKKDDGFFGLDQ